MEPVIFVGYCGRSVYYHNKRLHIKLSCSSAVLNSAAGRLKTAKSVINWSRSAQTVQTFLFMEVSYCSRNHQKKVWFLSVIEAKIFMINVYSQGWTKNHDRIILEYSLVSKDTPKHFSGLYL